MLTDGRTDGRTDDGRKVITIAHPEQSSGELKKNKKRKEKKNNRNNCRNAGAKLGAKVKQVVTGINYATRIFPVQRLRLIEKVVH